MAIEIRTITSQQEWLKWREADITASVAAALIGLHERITPLMLFLDKTGTAPFDNIDSAPMRRGRLMQPVAVEVLRELYPDWEILPASDYIRDTTRRIGCTPDAYIRIDGRLYAVVEIKNIEPYQFERSWRDEDGGITPPMAAAIQALLCAHLTKAEKAFVAALRVGHAVDLDLIEIPKPEGLIERLEGAAEAFWESVARNEPPAPNYLVDAELVLRLHAKADPGKAIDLTGNNRLSHLAEEWKRLGDIETNAAKERKAIKAEVLDMLGDAELGVIDGRVAVSARVTEVKEAEAPRKAYTQRKLVFTRRAA